MSRSLRRRQSPPGRIWQSPPGRVWLVAVLVGCIAVLGTGWWLVRSGSGDTSPAVASLSPSGRGPSVSATTPGRSEARAKQPSRREAGAATRSVRVPAVIGARAPFEHGPEGEAESQLGLEKSEEHRAASPPGHAAYERGVGARRRGDHAGALAAFQRAIELEPDNSDYLLAAGREAQELRLFSEAEQLFGDALAIEEAEVGPVHPRVAAALGELGSVYVDQQRYEEAEALYQRALEINQQFHGHEHFEVAAALNTLALLHRRRGRNEQAVPLLEEALAIEERVRGGEHPNVAARLGALGMAHLEQGSFEEARELLERALYMRENLFGSDDPETAGALSGLARVYSRQGLHAEAEPYLRRALAIHENSYGPAHPTVAMDLARLGGSYLAQGRDADARPFVRRALTTEESVRWSVNPQVSTVLLHLAEVAQAEGRPADAEHLYQWLLEVSEDTVGPRSTNTVWISTSYARYLAANGRHEEAARLRNE